MGDKNDNSEPKNASPNKLFIITPEELAKLGIIEQIQTAVAEPRISPNISELRSKLKQKIQGKGDVSASANGGKLGTSLKAKCRKRPASKPKVKIISVTKIVQSPDNTSNISEPMSSDNTSNVKLPESKSKMTGEMLSRLIEQRVTETPVINIELKASQTKSKLKCTRPSTNIDHTDASSDLLPIIKPVTKRVNKPKTTVDRSSRNTTQTTKFTSKISSDSDKRRLEIEPARSASSSNLEEIDVGSKKYTDLEKKLKEKFVRLVNKQSLIMKSIPTNPTVIDVKHEDVKIPKQVTNTQLFKMVPDTSPKVLIDSKMNPTDSTVTPKTRGKKRKKLDDSNLQNSILDESPQNLVTPTLKVYKRKKTGDPSSAVEAYRTPLTQSTEATSNHKDDSQQKILANKSSSVCSNDHTHTLHSIVETPTRSILEDRVNTSKEIHEPNSSSAVRRSSRSRKSINYFQVANPDEFKDTIHIDGSLKPSSDLLDVGQRRSIINEKVDGRKLKSPPVTKIIHPSPKLSKTSTADSCKISEVFDKNLTEVATTKLDVETCITGNLTSTSLQKCVDAGTVKIADKHEDLNCKIVASRTQFGQTKDLLNTSQGYGEILATEYNVRDRSEVESKDTEYSKKHIEESAKDKSLIMAICSGEAEESSSPAKESNVVDCTEVVSTDTVPPCSKKHIGECAKHKSAIMATYLDKGEEGSSTVKESNVDGGLEVLSKDKLHPCSEKHPEECANDNKSLIMATFSDKGEERSSTAKESNEDKLYIRSKKHIEEYVKDKSPIMATYSDKSEESSSTVKESNVGDGLEVVCKDKVHPCSEKHTEECAKDESLIAICSDKGEERSSTVKESNVDDGSDVVTKDKLHIRSKKPIEKCAKDKSPVVATYSGKGEDSSSTAKESKVSDGLGVVSKDKVHIRPKKHIEECVKDKNPIIATYPGKGEESSSTAKESKVSDGSEVVSKDKVHLCSKKDTEECANDNNLIMGTYSDIGEECTSTGSVDNNVKCLQSKSCIKRNLTEETILKIANIGKDTIDQSNISRSEILDSSKDICEFVPTQDIVAIICKKSDQHSESQAANVDPKRNKKLTIMETKSRKEKISTPNDEQEKMHKNIAEINSKHGVPNATSIESLAPQLHIDKAITIDSQNSNASRTLKRKRTYDILLHDDKRPTVKAEKQEKRSLNKGNNEVIFKRKDNRFSSKTDVDKLRRNLNDELFFTEMQDLNERPITKSDNRERKSQHSKQALILGDSTVEDKSEASIPTLTEGVHPKYNNNRYTEENEAHVEGSASKEIDHQDNNVPSLIGTDTRGAETKLLKNKVKASVPVPKKQNESKRNKKLYHILPSGTSDHNVNVTCSMESLSGQEGLQTEDRKTSNKEIDADNFPEATHNDVIDNMSKTIGSATRKLKSNTKGNIQKDFKQIPANKTFEANKHYKAHVKDSASKEIDQDNIVASLVGTDTRKAETKSLKKKVRASVLIPKNQNEYKRNEKLYHILPSGTSDHNVKVTCSLESLSGQEALQGGDRKTSNKEIDADNFPEATHSDAIDNVSKKIGSATTKLKCNIQKNFKKIPANKMFVVNKHFAKEFKLDSKDTDTALTSEKCEKPRKIKKKDILTEAIFTMPTVIPKMCEKMATCSDESQAVDKMDDINLPTTVHHAPSTTDKVYIGDEKGIAGSKCHDIKLSDSTTVRDKKSSKKRKKNVNIQQSSVKECTLLLQQADSVRVDKEVAVSDDGIDEDIKLCDLRTTLLKNTIKKQTKDDIEQYSVKEATLHFEHGDSSSKKNNVKENVLAASDLNTAQTNTAEEFSNLENVTILKETSNKDNLSDGNIQKCIFKTHTPDLVPINKDTNEIITVDESDSTKNLSPQDNFDESGNFVASQGNHTLDPVTEDLLVENSSGVASIETSHDENNKTLNFSKHSNEDQDINTNVSDIRDENFSGITSLETSHDENDKPLDFSINSGGEQHINSNTLDITSHSDLNATVDLENVCGDANQAVEVSTATCIGSELNNISTSDLSSPKMKRKGWTGDSERVMKAIFSVLPVFELPGVEDSDFQEYVPKKKGRKKKNPVPEQNVESLVPADSVNYEIVEVNGMVTCAKCDLKIVSTQWDDHNYNVHYSLGWRKGEQPVNMEDRPTVMGILKPILKKVKLLNCSKCGDFSNKSAARYINHIAICDGFASKATVTCAVCKEEMENQLWPTHKSRIHNNLTWRQGEKPLNLNDQEFVVSVLSAIYRNKKTALYCYKCKEKKKSVFGFLSHQTTCMKSKQEIEQLKLKCDLCETRVLPVSMRDHIKLTHGKKQEALRAQMKLNVEDDLPNVRRKAAAKALDVIGTLKENELKPYTNHVKFEEDFVSSVLESQLLKHQKIECIFNPCDFESDRAGTMIDHLMSCDKKPKNYFACKACLYICEEKALLITHLKKSHKIKIREKNLDEGFDAEAFIGEHKLLKEKRKLQQDIQKRKLGDKKKLEENPNTKIKPVFLEEFRVIRKEIFSKAYKWTIQFCKEHFSENLLHEELNRTIESWTLLQNKLVDKYLPTLLESCDVAQRYVREYEPPRKNLPEFKRYSLFESTTHAKGNVTLFCGGPVTAMAWMPTPYTESSISQVLAVAVSKDPDKIYRCEKSYNEQCLIQFWEFGTLKNIQNPPITTKLRFSLAYDYGPVWHLEWCPSGSYNNETINRLGLLATTGCDSFVYIYSIPCFTEEEEGLFYKAVPVLMLQLHQNQENNSDTPTYYPTRISWSKAAGHNYIAVGYTEGMVALFDISVQSELLTTKSEDDYARDIIFPYQLFQPHVQYITGLSLFHFNGANRWLATSSVDHNMAMWDLKTVTKMSSRKKYVVSDIQWPVNWVAAFYACGESVTVLPHISSSVKVARDCYNDRVQMSIMPSFSSVTSISFSDWLNSLIQVSSAGEIMFQMCSQLMFCIEQKTLKVRRYLLGYADLTEKVRKLPGYYGEESFRENVPDYNLMKYNHSKDKYGIVFCDLKLDSYGDFSKNIPDQLATTSKRLQTSRVDMYPLSSINKIAFNPNLQSSTYFAAGYQSGFVRINCLKFLNLDSQIL